MQLDRHYTDELLVSIYDMENVSRRDIDFYLALARELEPTQVVDLGCGTGLLACGLADAGHLTTGVDPAAQMLAYARSRPGGDTVEWVMGDAGVLVSGSADLIVMTGHVAQVFLTDADWETMLADCGRALRPGGHLAFEVRNPEAQGWLRWRKKDTFGVYPLPTGGTFSSWVEVTGVRGPLVYFEGHNVFDADADVPSEVSGVDLMMTSTLRFRTRSEVERSLVSAGFEVREVYGDWDRSPVGRAGPDPVGQASPDPVGQASPELIFLARRP